MLIEVCCASLANYLAKLFSITIAYVDPNITGKTVGEKHAQLLSQCRPGDNEMKLSIVISIVDVNVVSLTNVAMADQADPSQKIRVLGRLPTAA